MMNTERFRIVELSLIWLAFAILMMFLVRCTNSDGKNSTDGDRCLCPDPPLITLYLVPMDGISEAVARKLADEFQKNFGDRQWEPYNVEILPHIDTPASCLNSTKSRLRADSIIKMLNIRYKDSCRKKAAEADGGNGEYHVMGVTNRDISTTVHGHEDYGILGLSYIRGPHVGVVSTKRLRNKKDLWKLTVHEFCHGFYGCPHCKNDDPHCLMADARGGIPTSN